MSAPHLVDLPAFGANASTIADRLGELTPSTTRASTTP